MKDCTQVQTSRMLGKMAENLLHPHRLACILNFLLVFTHTLKAAKINFLKNNENENYQLQQCFTYTRHYIIKRS